MKRILFPALLLLMITASCKKETTQAGLKDLLLGNWNYQKLVSQSYKADGTLITEMITPINSADYGYYFKSDGTCSQRFGGEPSNETYEILSDNEFKINTGAENLCKVVSINENNIIFTVITKKSTDLNYTSSTHYLSR